MKVSAAAHLELGRTRGRAPVAHAATVVFALLLSATVLFGLQGCKPTDVLTEHVEDQENGELDTTVTPLYKEKDSAPADARRSSKEVKDSTRTDLQEEKTPVYKKGAADRGEAIWRKYDKNSPYKKNAAQGTQTNNSNTEGQQTKQDKSQRKTASSSKSSSSKSTTQKQKSGGEDDSKAKGKAKVSVGIGGTGTSYDTTGKQSKLPEKCSKVAACGYYATIVQMLGGQGGLVACDSYWQAQVKKRGLFPKEGVEKIDAVWTSNSDGEYKLDVAKLIKAKPDAILVDNAQFKLTSSQLKKIKKAKIDVVYMPALGDSSTTDAEVIAAVNTVGELLKNSKTVYYSTQQTANSYEKFHEQVISQCLDSNGGYTSKYMGSTSTTEIFQASSSGDEQKAEKLSKNRVSVAFVDDWISTTKQSITADRNYSGRTLYLDGQKVNVASGVGISASLVKGRYALIDYYFQVSGVMNTAYDGAKPSIGDNGLSARYVIIPGTVSKSDSSYTGKADVQSRSSQSAMWYSTGSSSSSSSDESSGQTWHTVGEEDFPGVVTKTKSQAMLIKNSASKVNGIYNVDQKYKIWVMPSGIDGSWSTGTAESFLASMWTCKNITASINSNAAPECNATVNNYYKTFYRCSAKTGSKSKCKVTDYTTSYTATCPRQ